MRFTLPAWARPVLAAFIALLVGAGGAVVITSDGDDVVVKPQIVPAAPPATAVDGPDHDSKRDDALPLDTAAVRELQDAAAATTAPGDTHRELAEPLREPGDGPVVLNEGPLAAQEFPGCRTRFVANSSSRNGARPQVIVWHQTVSRDRPGRSDQDGLTAMANSRSSGVSWHLLIGGQDGLCTFSVPLNLKAWTQANANPFSIGIEVQAFGDEPAYVSGPGKARLFAATRELGRRFGIPMRRAIVRNCRVIQSGIAEHHDLGICGGGHVDVSSSTWQRNPNGPELAGWDIGPLIAELAQPACSTRCRRARDLRTRNAATHAELRRRSCAPAAHTRSDRCRFLHRRHRAIHHAAEAERIKL